MGAQCEPKHSEKDVHVEGGLSGRAQVRKEASTGGEGWQRASEPK